MVSRSISAINIMILDQYKSPNFDKRIAPIDTIVIHATNMPEQPSIDRLCDPKSKVSCHYVISQGGVVYRLVDEKKRAWHAGVSCWRGKEAVNDFSIGIELVNPNHLQRENIFTDKQMRVLINLLHDLILKYNIQPQNIVAHSDIAPMRKDDPGQYFDWKLLAENGIGIFPDKLLGDKTAFIKFGDKNQNVLQAKQLLHKFGYNLAVDAEFNQEMADVIVAFKRRFYPNDLSPSLNAEAYDVLVQITTKLIQN